jgi:hypothetical protein
MAERATKSRKERRAPARKHTIWVGGASGAPYSRLAVAAARAGALTRSCQARYFERTLLRYLAACRRGLKVDSDGRPMHRERSGSAIGTCCGWPSRGRWRESAAYRVLFLYLRHVGLSVSSTAR